MTIQTLTQFFLQYGAFFIFAIVFLEYLNLPGFPAGLIMPLAGIWAAKGEISFPLVLLISVGAGLSGSWALYFLGRLGLKRAFLILMILTCGREETKKRSIYWRMLVLYLH